MRFFVTAGLCLALLTNFSDSAYGQSRSSDGDGAIGYFNLANELAEEGKVDEAIANYRSAIRLEPYNADVHYNLGYWLNVQGQLVEAEAAYREADTN